MTETEQHHAPWEYVVRTFESYGDATLTSLLDREGAQEWELVAFDFPSCRAIFKRPKTAKGK